MCSVLIFWNLGPESSILDSPRLSSNDSDGVSDEMSENERLGLLMKSLTPLGASDGETGENSVIERSRTADLTIKHNVLALSLKIERDVYTYMEFRLEVAHHYRHHFLTSFRFACNCELLIRGLS